MWDPKISEIGYGIHLLVIFTLVYLFIFLVLASFKTYFSDEKTKQMKIAKAIYRQRRRPIGQINESQSLPIFKKQIGKRF